MPPAIQHSGTYVISPSATQNGQPSFGPKYVLTLITLLFAACHQPACSLDCDATIFYGKSSYIFHPAITTQITTGVLQNPILRTTQSVANIFTIPGECSRQKNTKGEGESQIQIDISVLAGRIYIIRTQTKKSSKQLSIGWSIPFGTLLRDIPKNRQNRILILQVQSH